MILICKSIKTNSAFFTSSSWHTNTHSTVANRQAHSPSPSIAAEYISCHAQPCQLGCVTSGKLS